MRTETSATKRYPELLEQLLLHREPCAGITIVDLFCGCGGLSLGIEAAGLSVTGFDSNPDAVSTCRKNLVGHVEECFIDKNFTCPDADVIVGGPPCQPFSVLGASRGRHDIRDGFPLFVEAVRRVRPKLWMFENVTGLLRERSKAYLSEIMTRLRLLGYKIDHRVLNAVDFGVPQNRKRLVVVGVASGHFSWPEPDISRFTVGDAIGRTMNRRMAAARMVSRNMLSYIQRYEQASKCRSPRDLVADKPARTVTCRNLAGATGDMLRVHLPDGSRRMLTVREAARLQSFPDSYRFSGSFGSTMNQIGNAVPPLLALALGQAIRDHLS